MRNCRHIVFALVLTLSGCGLHSWTSPPPFLAGNGPTGENPVFFPVTDREFLWNQLVDSVDDYFQIEHEERVHVLGEVMTEGRIETAPAVGSTFLEPWRSDSSPGFEKWQSTLQSIRRRATVRATPTRGGYLVEVIVQKELEDVSQPEHATTGSSTMRHDGSLERRGNQIDVRANTLGWIPIGRDVVLEQRILADLRSRLRL